MPFTLISQEICGNGIDDDGDGAIDQYDLDCDCNSNPNIIRNGSFENFSQLPDSESLFQLADDWFRPNAESTPELFNVNGFMWSVDLISPPFPDGVSAAGQFYVSYGDDNSAYAEYIAQNISGSPLEPGKLYKLDFYVSFLDVYDDGILNSEVPISLFGSSSSISSAFTTSYTCPVNPSSNFQEIGHIDYNASVGWQKLSLYVEPNEVINTLIFGSSCTLPESFIAYSGLPYFAIDNFVLREIDEKIIIDEEVDFCENILTLSAIVPPNLPDVEFQWYRNGQILENETSSFLDINIASTIGGYYTVRVFRIGSCYDSETYSFHQETYDSPLPPQIQLSYSCDDNNAIIEISNPNTNYEYSFDGGITWTSNASSGFLNPGEYNVIARDENECQSAGRLIEIVNTLQQIDLTITQPNCNPSGEINILNIAQEYSIDGGNTWNFNSIFNNLSPGIYSVKLKYADGCESASRLVEIEESNAPIINLKSSYEICPEEESITIAELSNFESYLWSTGATSSSITLNEIGLYSLTVTNSLGCSSTQEFELVYSQPAVLDFSLSGNDLVVTSPSINHEYSLDNNDWQLSNVFSNLENGFYDLYVRSTNQCFSYQRDFFVFNVPNIITPNGDGINDTWQFSWKNDILVENISLYDRYGKKIYAVNNPESVAWPSTNLKNKINSGTYWYLIKLKNPKSLISGALTVKQY